jgi:hypothetical protein
LGGAAASAALVLLSGCELIVDFDRSKIPQDSGTIYFETSTGDAGGDADATMGSPGSPDADAGGSSTDADAAATDGRPETSVTSDANPEAMSETGPADAPPEAAQTIPEAGPDAPSDVSNASDVAPEVGTVEPESGGDDSGDAASE